MNYKELNFVGVGIAIVVLVFLSFYIDIESLKDWVKDSGMWAPLTFILLKISTIVVAPLSGGPLYPLAGLLFGFWPGFLYVAIGDLLGFTIAFWISRILGREIVLRLISENEKGLLSRIIGRMSTLKGFFITCIIFLPAPELVSYASGLTKIRYPLFIAILWPLYLIASSLLVFAGSIIDFDKPLTSILYVIFMIFVGIIIVGSFWWFFVRQEEELENK